MLRHDGVGMTHIQHLGLLLACCCLAVNQRRLLFRDLSDAGGKTTQRPRPIHARSQRRTPRYSHSAAATTAARNTCKLAATITVITIALKPMNVKTIKIMIHVAGRESDGSDRKQGSREVTDICKRRQDNARDNHPRDRGETGGEAGHARLLRFALAFLFTLPLQRCFLVLSKLLQDSLCACMRAWKRDG